MDITTPNNSRPYPETYNPALGRPAIISPADWQAIRPYVLAAISPLNHLSSSSLIFFLRALIRLCLYLKARGQDLETSFLLRPDVLAAYAKATKITRSEFGRLVRLSKEHGLYVDANLPLGAPRPSYTTPYQPHEVDALLRAAENLSTENRRLTATSVIVLGAGCGIVRQSAASVTASDVHYHESDLFVRVDERCAKVRDQFKDQLEELTSKRPTGFLRGNLLPDHVVGKVREWLSSMPGVPILFVDQLRATYICTLLEAKAPLVDLLTWCGLKSAEAFDGYLAHIDTARTCPATTKESK